jgi:hypothetical protein
MQENDAATNYGRGTTSGSSEGQEARPPTLTLTRHEHGRPPSRNPNQARARTRVNYREIVGTRDSREPAKTLARRVLDRNSRPFDRNERCGGLWSASPRLHLWSLLTVRSHALLGFFLDHYARHGVLLQTNAHVVLHEDFAPTTALVAAQKALSLRGVSHDVIPSVDARLLEQIKIARLNRAIRKLPENALVIFADGNTLRLTTSTVSARR